ncbi:ribonuclease H-like domain-containing protein [Tanacetum coccineum]|uniref:Ribonuclease H-like domain-containing protein n=1 Tax=Tanacetum coccineum TaxID=301880 RepID=A0ABQ4WE71_9ASTR
MTDLGELNYFLGIFADRTPIGLFLSQKKYALPALELCYMDPTLYRSLAEGSTLKRILRYVRGTVDFGLQLYVSATTSLVGFTDADWACFPSTQFVPQSAREELSLSLRYKVM